MWYFNCPKVVFGEDALSRLADLVGQRAFIVTDANMVSLGIVGRVTEILEGSGIEHGYFAEVEPEPSIDTAMKARQALVDFAPDIVIGLGGGSCLDVCKVAWFLFERPEITLDEISPFTDYQVGETELVAIPTTSGTGADASVGVVLTDTQAGQKVVVYALEFQPQLTILDPSLVTGLPPQITADTGLDVVSHAVEGFASPWNNDFADALCLRAIQLVFSYLPQAYADGLDLEARERMHNAATMAGIGMTNSSIGLGHALAHSLGAVFPQPHGRAVGLVLPYSIEYTANGGGTRYAAMARALDLPARDEAQGAASLANAVRELARSLNQPLTIAELGISRQELAAAMPELVVKAAEDRQMLTTPRVPENEEIERLFWYAFDGRSVDF
jgi:alcohol dehydrogenase class IV